MQPQFENNTCHYWCLNWALDALVAKDGKCFRQTPVDIDFVRWRYFWQIPSALAINVVVVILKNDRRWRWMISNFKPSWMVDGCVSQRAQRSTGHPKVPPRQLSKLYTVYLLQGHHLYLSSGMELLLQPSRVHVRHQCLMYTNAAHLQRKRNQNLLIENMPNERGRNHNHVWRWETQSHNERWHGRTRTKARQVSRNHLSPYVGHITGTPNSLLAAWINRTGGILMNMLTAMCHTTAGPERFLE